ncbi:MAG: formate dehydrogenase subunit alpha [Burkholderiales bacterium]
MSALPETESTTVVFNLNGKQVAGGVDETLLQIARRNGVEIPHLCYKDGMRPDGNCRACVVEIKGERVLAPSCCRYPKAGMEVSSHNDRALAAQKMVLELLLSDMPDDCHSRDDELRDWSEKMRVGKPRFDRRAQPQMDSSHPAIAVNLEACIQCGRCVRACREVQMNDVIGFAGRGSHSKIVFDFDDPMGESTCVGCGECVQACPTGALAPGNGAALQEPAKEVDSLCPFCGVGCQVTYKVKHNTIIDVEGRDGPANHGRLCVKGRYGTDYVHHPQRLTKPLIRREGIRKTADFTVDPANFQSVFREASWDEALDLVAAKLKSIRATFGAHALAGFGSAKCSNEEAYLFQKLVRTGFGNNNVDHCTRLCHASSVAALLEGIGSGAVSNPVHDVQYSDVIFIIGANPTSNHPVAATFIKNAVERGAKLIIADPRLSDLSRHATHALQFKADTDVALLNAIMHVIVEEGLTDADFIQRRTSGFDALKQNLKDYSPAAMAPICGIDAETIKAVARLYATSKASMILWGMGISQHIHGTDNARCLIALSLMTGQIGRRGSGLHPLRGQNNVQGASDAGLIPMMFPDYHRTDNDVYRAKMEKLWDAKLDPAPGLTVVEIMKAIHAGSIRGMYIMGENPAMSDPDLQHARASLAELDFLAVQDIFMTETAAFADVVLPASAFAEKTGTYTNTDRTVQMARQALQSPGDARPDWWITVQIARRLGLGWDYPSPKEIFDEMRQTMPSIGGMTWERLQQDGAITYPCEKEGDVGEEVVFVDHFHTSDGKAKFVPARFTPAAERPDQDYPFVLITGRQLEHWHTGAMTRRSPALNAIESGPTVSLHPADLQSLGVKAGETITVQSRRGSIVLAARADANMPRNTVFIPFAYVEAAANLLTNPALDPFGKIPEFKYCAVKVERGGTLAAPAFTYAARSSPPA